MRILQVIHDYLPRHRAGSEVYTHLLSRALIARGNDVTVLYAERDLGRLEYSTRRLVLDGVPLVEVVWNDGAATFSETYENPRMEALFSKLLDEIRPDVVHLQHLEHFSIGLPAVARRRGIPVVFTLHEYCLTCPRKGLRMMADLSLCHEIDPMKCAVCIERQSVSPPTVRARLESFAKRAIPARARRFVRKRLASVGLARHPDRPAEAPAGRPVDRAPHALAIERRLEAVLAMTRGVDLFIAPSPFLRRKFVEFGVDEDRILESDYGTDLAPFAGFSRAPSDRLRFGYVGTLVEHKGVHVLVEAMNGLPEGSAELLVHGEPSYFPEYAARVRALARHPGTRFMGPFDNGRIADILRDLDVLVVPSLWFENSPLTIHEAFASKTPVIATDLGGMKDLVVPERNGLLFERGSAEALRRAMRRLVDEPDLVGKLRAGIPALKSMDRDAEDMEERYRRLLSRAKERAAAPAR